VQSEGKKPIAVWVAFGALAGAWLFGAGLLIGREMPAHHFERFGSSGYLFDTSTGSLCTAFGTGKENPIDQALATPKYTEGLASLVAPVPPCASLK